MLIDQERARRIAPLPGNAKTTAGARRADAQSAEDARALYGKLVHQTPQKAARAAGAQFLREQLARTAWQSDELPDSPDDLLDWMAENAQVTTARYAMYLAQRKEGAPRRYFSNRAHALNFLRCVAPTKLVDGAWLYGLVAHWQNQALAHLVRTYLEELGEGDAQKNHVLLYRRLLASHGLDTHDEEDGALYVQGLVQLALGWNAEEFLPEVIGFNLGYEQLPLHLLITAYELAELGLDPYYFTLHVTVDNADSGHARRACQAVLDMLPRLGGRDEFWRRVRQGAKLANAGKDTAQVIAEFDIEREVVSILARKSVAGRGAHSDYCRIAGRNVNDWLSRPEQVPAFLEAMQEAGWISRGSPAHESRFWKLLQGERAQMFGVFSGYELQVIHDWIRGPSSSDGLSYADAAQGMPARRPVRFRAPAQGSESVASLRAIEGDLLDPDLQVLQSLLEGKDAQGRMEVLAGAISPAQHWTPAGLRATRLFCGQLFQASRSNA